MNKKQMLMSALAIGVVLLFIFELFAVGFFRTGVNPFTNGLGDPTVQTSQEQGIAEFEATLKYYESYLITTQSLSNEQLESIKSHSKILSVTNSQQGYIIELRAKDDVQEVYGYLVSNNITSKSVGIFGAPPLVGVTLADGRVLETNGNDRYLLRKEMEPTLDKNAKVNARMVAVVRNGLIISYGEIEFLSTTASFTSIGTIKELKYVEYQYSIPWEVRNTINTSEILNVGAENATYTRKDLIILSPHLSIQEQQEKRNLSYITSISQNSASVNRSFTDKTRIIQDFNNSNVTFPSSSLLVRSNQTVTVPYPATLRYAYVVSLNDTTGVLQDDEIELMLGSFYDAGNTISLNITGESVGGTIRRIISIQELNVTQSNSTS